MAALEVSWPATKNLGSLTARLETGMGSCKSIEGPCETIEWIRVEVGVRGSPLAEQKRGDERRCAAAVAGSKPSTSSQDEVGKGGCA